MTKKNQFFSLISNINTGLKTKQLSVKVKSFLYAEPLLNLLRNDGYIYGFRKEGNIFKIFLKYFKNKSVFIKFEGKSSAAARQFFKVNKLQFNAIYSTSSGLFFGKQLKKKKLGGELLVQLY